jgi:serine/threonine protein kinase
MLRLTLRSAIDLAESLEQFQRVFTAYTIERELGSGGMATVYLAHDKIDAELKLGLRATRAALPWFLPNS